MQIMARDRDLSELTEDLRGKTVAIWTCNTCARLCDFGGSANAQKLASALRAEGISVTGVSSSKAACVRSSVSELAEGGCACDVILALTCDVGARLATHVSGATVINPAVTLGAGYLDGAGKPVLVEGQDSETPLDALISVRGVRSGPFIK